MRVRSHIVCIVGVMLLLFAVSADAQPITAQATNPQLGPAPPYPRFEVTGTYQVLHVQQPACDEDCGETFPFGLNVDGAYNGSKAFGLAGEIGWATKDIDDERVHVWNIGVGPRFNGRPAGARVWPFVHVLVGAEFDRVEGETDTHLTVQPGGGVNINAGDGWGFVIGGDYRRVFLDEEEFGASGRNDFRVTFGIRLLLD